MGAASQTTIAGRLLFFALSCAFVPGALAAPAIYPAYEEIDRAHVDAWTSLLTDPRLSVRLSKTEATDLFRRWNTLADKVLSNSDDRNQHHRLTAALSVVTVGQLTSADHAIWLERLKSEKFTSTNDSPSGIYLAHTLTKLLESTSPEFMPPQASVPAVSTKPAVVPAPTNPNQHPHPSTPMAHDRPRVMGHEHSRAEVADRAKQVVDAWGMTPRQAKIASADVQTVLDKCVACHVMEPAGSRAHDLSNKKLLQHAMREGEGGTFQRKILRMMGPEADARHVHFNIDEIRTIYDVYFGTRSDDEVGEPPRPEPEVMSPLERSFAQQTPRARALQRPIVVMGLTRCLMCHRDPKTRGAEDVDTMSELRGAMRTIDAKTIKNMIARGYQHERMLHIQDLKDGPALESALMRITELPEDRPDSRQ